MSVPFDIDRRAFIASLGGAAAVALMDHEARAEALEEYTENVYAFDPNAVVSIDPFMDIIGRHFKQPKEGLGHDNSPVAHMWRTLINPDAPLQARRRFYSSRGSCSGLR